MTRPAELRKQAWASVGLPIFALIATVLLMALGLLTNFAKEQDRAFEANSRQLVANEINGHISGVRDLSLDWSNWQAAYDNVTARWNGAWIKETFFTDLVDHVRIVRDGETRYAWSAVNLPASNIAIDAVVRKNFEVSAVPKHLNNVFHAQNTLYIMSTQPILPEIGKGPVRDNIVLVRSLDPAKLAALGRKLGLENLRIAPRGGQTSHEIIVSLKIGDVKLIWDHERPGSAGFSRLAALVLSWVSLVGMLAFVVARRQVHKQIALASAQQASLEASRLKSQFLFTMSHELRTPLNSIIGYSELLEEDLAQAPEMASPDDARRIRGAADHLLTLINEVLDLSAIESGKLTLNKAPVDVGVILQEVADSVRPIGAKQGTSVSISLEKDIPSLEIDGQRLQQCALHLASNACKFTQNGQVEISASMEGESDNPKLKIVVADNGIGITPEIQSRLFQPFVQVDNSATRVQEGTGLGLAITQKLAQAMGGSVELDSAPGKGSIFTLTINADLTDQPPKMAKAA
jgi:signal transduction histidine kinase